MKSFVKVGLFYFDDGAGTKKAQIPKREMSPLAINGTTLENDYVLSPGSGNNAFKDSTSDA